MGMATDSRQQPLTLIFLPKNLCEIKCVFDRRIPHLCLESELHLCRPFGYRGKLEEISGHDELFIFRENGAKIGRRFVLGFLQTAPRNDGGC